MAHTHATRADERVLGEKIKGIKVALLTTIDKSHNTLRSRPMVTQETPFDGTLWFITQISSPIANEAENRQVNVGYASPDDNRYISVSGMARIVRDRQKITELWQPMHNTWFSGGEDNPDLALIKVTVTLAEYWDGTSHKMVQFFQTASE